MPQSAALAEGEVAEELVAGRYRIEETLGRGGMAVVHRVFDVVSGEHRALKRLLSPDLLPKRIDAVAFFEREYFTLAQLAHPRIVKVYDYGIDAAGPFYTMELLDGGDLQQKAPVDWRKACAFARDVCSALALVHSRCSVYRDVSPRNIRCTSDGLAKLIDFGAMGAMGPAREIIGTLPCCSPESISLYPLDARTDLYAVGATLYFTLVGRHAYPAREVARLPELWATRPRWPSEIVAGIPKELDALVMDLMSLDPAVRPASAAEVMERLSAIMGQAIDEQLLVSQAYLSTPTLVGREAELTAVQKLLKQAQGGRGASVLIRGAPGVGRTRLLAACVLEAKLLGAAVVRADAGDSSGESYAVVRELGAELLRVFPNEARTAAEPLLSTLGTVIPELCEGRPDVTLEVYANSVDRSRRVKMALRRWIADVVNQRPLLVAVDDADRVDEASATLLALLSSELSGIPVVLVATVDARAVLSRRAESTLRLWSEASTVLDVEPLSAEHAEQLLGAVFGEQPTLSPLAHRLFTITSGNPRDVMRLAQHLVDNGSLRYQAGAWILPQQVDAIDLPSSMAQALRERVAALDEDSRRLAQTMVLAKDEHLSVEECLLLTTHEDRARLAQHLAELVGKEVLVSEAQGYVVGRQGVGAALLEDLEPDRVRPSHLRLAEIFERRGDGFRAARHLFGGGEEERGLDVLVAYSAASEAKTIASSEAYLDLLRTLPNDWYAIYELGMALAESRGRPKNHLAIILNRFVGIAGTLGCGGEYFEKLIGMLSDAAGLGLHARLDAALHPGERLKRAVGAAMLRHSEMEEADRIAEPRAALVQLSRALISAVGLFGISGDYEAWRRLPSLAPFAPVSPALATVHQLVQGAGLRLSGRTEECLRVYRALLDRLSLPDRGGIEDAHHRHMRCRVISSVCMLEATMGVVPDAAYMAELEADGYYEGSAVLVRMLEQVWRGNALQADRTEREVARLRVQIAILQRSDGTHLLSELVAYGLMGDLTRVKRALEGVLAMASEFPPWVPVLHFARGQYHGLRGDVDQALSELVLALAGARPGRHRIWPHAAGAQVTLLLEKGLVAEARAAGEAHLRAGEEASIGYTKSYIEMPLSLALAKQGEHLAAAAMADDVIGSFAELGISGLNLSVAHEARARVAFEAEDWPSFDVHLALAKQHRHGGATALKASRYQRRARTITGVGLTVVNESSLTTAELTTALEGCTSATARAERGLELLVRHCKARGGVLYVLEGSRLVCRASLGLLPDAEVDALAASFLASQTEDGVDTAAIEEPSGPPSEERAERVMGSNGYSPVLLSHGGSNGHTITGVAILVADGSTHLAALATFASEFSRISYETGDVSVITP